MFLFGWFLLIFIGKLIEVGGREGRVFENLEKLVFRFVVGGSVYWIGFFGGRFGSVC